MKRAAGVVAAALLSAAMPAASTPISIQLLNPDAQIAVRVFLDRKEIYPGPARPVPIGVKHSLPIDVGSFELDAAPHRLIVEAAPGHAKAQLEWRLLPPKSYIIIRYYPGRGEATEPPFFTFQLDPLPAVVK